ncbi:MAG: hypothetical protein KKA79_06910, partial [Nanoarchaeota archaeon]|nr:hypothetical protein [Nanoarchaeota archaeon]
NELQRIEQQPRKTTKPKISFKDEISSLKQELSNIKKDVNVNNEKIDELDSNIQNLKESISDLSTTIRKNYTIDNMENLLKIIRTERTHIDKLSPNSFDSIKKNIREKGYKDENILREGLAIMVLDYLIDASKKLQFEEDIELFFKVLSETLPKETKLLDSAPIPAMRRIITSKLNITHEDFDRMLVKCFSNGWVFLEGGSPIGESDVKYLTIDDKKYYYVKLKRKV